MLISNIFFFIECADILRTKYSAGTGSQKKQLVTFLKTWLWYNSGSKNIFWRGWSTEEGRIERVKEHWYSNLSTANFLMDKGIRDLSRKEQVLWIFKRMQWNYTSVKENQRLIHDQDYTRFYGKLKGDASKLYENNNLVIGEEKRVDLLPKLKDFFEAGTGSNTLYAEISFEEGNNRKFQKGISFASESLKIDYKDFMVSSKGWLVSTHGMSDMFKLLMSGFWAGMKEDVQSEFVEYLWIWN